MITAKRRKKLRAMVKDIGIDAVAEKEGLKRESVRRYVRNEGDDASGPDVQHVNVLLRRIEEMYTPGELKALANGAMPKVLGVRPIHDFRGKTITIGAMSDTHLGSKYTNPDFVQMAFDEFARAEVDFVTIGGDVSEGFSHRDGHVYECTHIGYASQKAHSVEVLSQWTDTEIYMIDGNHDRWYVKRSGAYIVQDICAEIPNAKFIGCDEGDIELAPGVILKLWHGEDSSSYALSYRLQKIIESFTGGEKPAVLFAGHVHKMIHCFIRHVHCVSTGSIQKQTKWMRAKRIPAHTGFWIVDLDVNDKGIASCRAKWFPFYV